MNTSKENDQAKGELPSQSSSAILLSVQTKPVDLPLQTLTPLHSNTPLQTSTPRLHSIEYTMPFGQQLPASYRRNLFDMFILPLFQQERWRKFFNIISPGTTSP